MNEIGPNKFCLKTNEKKIARNSIVSYTNWPWRSRIGNDDDKYHRIKSSNSTTISLLFFRIRPSYGKASQQFLSAIDRVRLVNYDAVDNRNRCGKPNGFLLLLDNVRRIHIVMNDDVKLSYITQYGKEYIHKHIKQIQIRHGLALTRPCRVLVKTRMLTLTGHVFFSPPFFTFRTCVCSQASLSCACVIAYGDWIDD